MELPLGELCAECRREIEGRARTLGRYAALAAAAGMGLYAMLRLPPHPVARAVGALAVVAWYVLVRVVVTRVAREFFR